MLGKETVMGRDASVQVFDRCTKLLLEVEMAKGDNRAAREFNDLYMKNAGNDSPFKHDSGEAHYLLHEKRVSFECRVYFSGPDWIGGLKGIGCFHSVEPRPEGGFIPQGVKFRYRDEYGFRISNQKLFFKLVADGYHLGVNVGRGAVPAIETHPAAAPAVATPPVPSIAA